ncbi:MAG: hypothetical protein IJ751_03635 [Oscillospiraceae bacterium]|nr:hypothetical protein [Oscillospiraceae bacterium]
MDEIEIRSGTFCAHIDLSKLHLIPQRNLERLVKIARAEPENEFALRVLDLWSQACLETANSELKAAEQDYSTNYKEVNPRSRTKAARAILAENKRLRSRVQECRVRLRQAQKLFALLCNQTSAKE